MSVGAILIYKTLFFNIVAAISCAFFASKEHAMLIKICASRSNPLFHSCYDHRIIELLRLETTLKIKANRNLTILH